MRRVLKTNVDRLHIPTNKIFNTTLYFNDERGSDNLIERWNASLHWRYIVVSKEFVLLDTTKYTTTQSGQIFS